jgi:hypothetical protein
VEWAAKGSSTFAYFGGNTNPVQNGYLANLDTRTLPNGEYILRVTVVDQTGNYPEPCEVSVRIAN